ncbi:MAG: glutamine amidotransferase, partial [Kiritimatiellae bacterium]|nr:glutamine amidotransferase [Kiritimatiellia bacterium]
PWLAAEETARIPWLGENLAPNANFEEVAEDGRTPEAWKAQIPADRDATVASDATVFLKGKRCLKISVPRSEARVEANSPSIPVEGGATYLFSIAFRQEGFNSTGERSRYEGISSYARIQWLDDNKQSVGQSTALPFPYGPSRWDLRDAFQPAPTNARLARIQIVVSNGSQKHSGKTVPATLWVDAVQLRKYTPPPTPDWAKGESLRVVDGAATDTRLLSYFVASDDTFRSRGGTWSRIVTDPQAERGTALQAPPKVGRGIMTHSPYWPALPAGLYRVRARVKIPAVTESAPVGYMDVDSQYDGQRQILPFVPSRETEGTYRDVEADFILRDSGWWDLRLFTHGKETWWVDSLKVFCLHELEDRQLLAIYPGSEGELPADLKPARFKPVVGGPRKPMKGLVVAGLGYDRFRMADVFHVLHRDAEMKAVWAKLGMGGMVVTGFPEDPSDLFQYSIIYLCNVNVRGIGLKYKNAISEYVKRGGALVILGGHQAYERGGWRGSLIEETMPIQVAPVMPGGLIHFKNGKSLKLNSECSWLEAVSTDCAPLVYYLHTATVKPTGQVLVWAGNKPFIVTGAYGEGRVVCILGVPWGDPGPTETGFWEWNDWVDLFREVCWWAMKNPADLTPENTDGMGQ